MKKIFSLFLIAVATIAALGACSRKGGNDAQVSVHISGESAIPEIDTAQESSLPPAVFQYNDYDFAASAETAAMPSQSEEEPVISIGYALDNISGDHHFFADDQPYERIIFHARESLENFAYIEILPSEDAEGNFALLIGEALFGLDDFTPDKPFVAATSIGSGIPARGIHFEHRGMVRYFYITESGMDGSLQLVEFTPFFG